jgi:hypothetical protein
VVVRDQTGGNSPERLLDTAFEQVRRLQDVSISIDDSVSVHGYPHSPLKEDYGLIGVKAMAPLTICWRKILDGRMPLWYEESLIRHLPFDDFVKRMASMSQRCTLARFLVRPRLLTRS